MQGGKEYQSGDPESKVLTENTVKSCVIERSMGRAKEGASYMSLEAKNILETLELLKITCSPQSQNQLCDIVHSTFPLRISVFHQTNRDGIGCSAHP